MEITKCPQEEGRKRPLQQNKSPSLKVAYPTTSVFAIDSFRGRESDIITFSTVRYDIERGIGFVEDERWLNVMLALIVVGDRKTPAEKSVEKGVGFVCAWTLLEDSEATQAL